MAAADAGLPPPEGLRSRRASSASSVSAVAPTVAVPWLHALRVLALAWLFFVDRLLSTFPFAFLAHELKSWGMANYAVGVVLALDYVGSVLGMLAMLVASYRSAAEPQRQRASPVPAAAEAADVRDVVDPAASLLPDEGATVRVAAATDGDTYQWAWVGLAMLGELVSLLILATFGNSYAAICVARLLHGLVSGVLWSFVMSITGVLPALWGMESGSWAITGASLGDIVGPYLGSLLYNATSESSREPYALALPLPLLGAVACVVVLVLRARFADRERARHATATAAVAAAPAQASTFASWFATSQFLSLVGILFVSGMLRTLCEAMTPLYLLTHGVTTSTIGLLFALGAFFYLVGSVAWGMYQTRASSVLAGLMVAMVAASVAAVPLVVTDVVAIYAVIFSLFSFAIVAPNIVVVNMVQRFATRVAGGDSQVVDRVMSMMNMIWVSGWGTGVLLAGLPDGDAGQRLVMAACATVALLATLLFRGGVAKAEHDDLLRQTQRAQA